MPLGDRNARVGLTKPEPDYGAAAEDYEAAPDVARPFRTPFVPFVPIAGVIANVILMLSLGWQNWLRLFVWMAIGLVIYAFYGYRHSKLAHGRD